jgi:methionyl-tRNA synthetase
LKYVLFNVGADINFSIPSLISMHNNELADILGNLVHRIFNLCKNYCNGEVPDCVHDAEFGVPFDLKLLVDDVVKDMKQYSINVAIFKAMDAARATNG